MPGGYHTTPALIDEPLVAEIFSRAIRSHSGHKWQPSGALNWGGCVGTRRTSWLSRVNPTAGSRSFAAYSGSCRPVSPVKCYEQFRHILPARAWAETGASAIARRWWSNGKKNPSGQFERYAGWLPRLSLNTTRWGGYWPMARCCAPSRGARALPRQGRQLDHFCQTSERLLIRSICLYSSAIIRSKVNAWRRVNWC